MFYLKHPQHGNRHVDTYAELQDLLAKGWVKWPRSKAEKEGLRISPVVGYERQKLQLPKGRRK